VTVAVVVAAGLSVVFVLEDEPGRRRWAVTGLCAAMALAFVAVAAIPAGRGFFELEPPTGAMVAAWAAGTAVVVGLLAVAVRVASALEIRASRRAARP
jgi:hypothetical protein